MKQMNPPTLAAFLETTSATLVDVREVHELAIGVLDNIIHIPMNQIPERLSELEHARYSPLVLICRSGKRSAQVGQYLEQIGFTDVINLEEGMNGWASLVDFSMTVY